MRHLLALTLLMLPAALAAQTTHIVDALGGPGVFPTLQAAVNAATNGDTIRVRPGNYNFGLTTAKGLTILGDGPTVPTFQGILRVSGLPAGQQFVMRNILAVNSTTEATGTLEIVQCLGRVVLDRLRLVGTVVVLNQARIGLAIFSSPQVSIHETSCIGYPGLSVSGSTVTVSNSTFQGTNIGFQGKGWTPQPGVIASSSTLTMTNCGLTGGSYVVFPIPTLSAKGLRAIGGTTMLAGGAITSAGPEAIQLDPTAQLFTDSAVQLVPNAIAGGTAVPLELGRASLSLVPPGQAGSAGFDGPACSTGILVWGLAGVPTSTPLGDLWLHPQVFAVLGVGSVPLQVPVTLANGTPPGFVIVVQGLLLGQPSVRLSNAVVATVP